jgi:hypothetical protein
MQKEWGVVMILLLASGCIDNRLTAGEVAICLNATQTQLSSIPPCLTPGACHAEWEKQVKVPPFHFLPVGGRVYQMQNAIEKTWESLARAHTLLQKTRLDCEKGNPLPILQNGFASAGLLHQSLKSSEEAYIHAHSVLTTSATNAHALDLTEVKDTKAYEKYAQILSLLQSTATDNSTSEIAQRMEENQSYYTNVGKLITQTPVPGYTPDWGKTFTWYDTGTKILFPEKKQTILWFSAVWKSLIASMTNTQNWGKNLYLLEHLNADALTQNIAMMVSPKNGTIIQMAQLAIDLENEIRKIDHDEEQELRELGERIFTLREKREQLSQKEKEEAVQALQPYFWAYDIPLPPKGEEGEITTLENALDELWEERARNTLSLGKRTTQRRQIKKRVYEEEEKTEIERRRLNDLDESCQKLSNALPQNANEMMAQDCKSLWLHVKAQKESVDADTNIREGKLHACTDEINEILNALYNELDIQAPENYVGEFGMEASLPACESTLQTLKKEYENNPTTRERQELQLRVKKQYEGLLAAHSLYAGLFSTDIEAILKQAKEALDRPEKWVTQNEQLNDMETLEMVETQMASEIQNGFQKYADSMEWKIGEPIPIDSGKEMEATITLHIPNPFGKTMFLPGEIIIRTPVQQVEAEMDGSALAVVETQENKIIVSEITLPSSGIVLTGKGKGIWVETSEHTRIVQVYGTTGVQQTILTLAREVGPVTANWSWDLPEGVDGSKIRATKNNQIIPAHQNGKTMGGMVELLQKKEEIILEYERKNGVKVNTYKTSEYQDETTRTTAYQITISNEEDVEITADISTGLIAPPAETQSIVAFNENGKTVKTEQGPLSQIILPDVIIPPSWGREYTLVITSDALMSPNSILETLIEEVKELAAHPNFTIAAEAAKLLNEIQKNNGTDTLPGLVQKVELLKYDARMTDDQMFDTFFEWDQWMNEWETNLGEWSDAEKRLMERGAEEKNEGDWGALKKTLSELKKMGGKNPAEKTTDENESEKKSAEEEIKKVMGELSLFEDTIEMYERSLSISCTKLRETGYFCPLTEEAVREMKKTNKAERGELEQQAKRAQKETTDKIKMEMDNERRADIQERIRNRGKEAENAQQAIHETAEGLVNEVQSLISTTGGSEEIKTAIKKAQDALEKGEYGKSIFIAKGLRDYIQSQNKLSGLFMLPPPTAWPLIGIILAAGGVLTYRAWKKRRIIPPEPKPLPRSGAQPPTILRHAPPGNDGPAPQRTQGEFQRERTRGE